MLRSFLAILMTLLTIGYTIQPAFALTADELQKARDEKAKAALEISSQIQAVNQQLNATQSQKNSLQKELKTIDYSVNQLNLGIKSSQINIEKLGFELQSVQLDIDKITEQINTKKAALMKLVRELYEKDKQGSLAMLLRNRSLADSFREQQSLSDLNNGISNEVSGLKELGKQLDGKFQDTSSKKKKIETENQNQKNRKAIVEDQKTERQQLLAQTKNQEKLYTQTLDELSKKQLEISAEIEKIESELRSKIDPSLLPIPRPGVLAMPAQGYITQEYGYTTFAKNGYKGHFHNGLDIGAPIGTEVVAAEKGKVVAVGNQDSFCPRGAYGKFIVIAHDNNLTTLYGHLSGYIVKVGDTVTRGQLIGYVGRTGYATGPHLHLTVYAGPTFYMGASRTCGPMPFGGDLDPAKYL